MPIVVFLSQQLVELIETHNFQILLNVKFIDNVNSASIEKINITVILCESAPRGKVRVRKRHKVDMMHDSEENSVSFNLTKEFL